MVLKQTSAHSARKELQAIIIFSLHYISIYLQQEEHKSLTQLIMKLAASPLHNLNDEVYPALQLFFTTAVPQQNHYPHFDHLIPTKRANISIPRAHILKDTIAGNNMYMENVFPPM